MSEYRVKQLWLSGKGKKMYKSGDVVTEKSFPEGNIETLIKEGRIELINSKGAKNVNVEIVDVEFEAEALFEIERKGSTVKIYTDSDLTKKEICSVLESREIDHDVNDNKATLWALLVSKL